jgi:membrane fusion protein, macrolide-specific efflux system
MKLPRKKVLLFGGLAVLLAVVGTLLYRTVFAPPPPPPYVTATVSRSDIEDSVIATGTIQSFRQVNVGAQASGQIKSLKVALGDTIKQGQLVAEIDSLTQQNTLRNAEAALQNSEAQLRAKQALLRQYELALKRQSEMLAANASTREAYEEAEANLATTQADIAALKAQITQARITVDTARLTLGYTRITAPMDGTVVAIINKEGQTVNASQSTPTIIILARMDKVTVKAEISEADVPRVKPGQAVYFSILGEPQKRYSTTVRAIEPAPSSISDSASTSTTTTTTSTSSTAIYYNGLLDVPNPEGTLRISMTTEVHIVLAQAKGVLSIPATALGERDAQGAYTVSVVNREGRAQPRKVHIGLNNKLSAEVLDGLQEGERIVLGEGSATLSTSSTRRPGPPPMM